MVAAASNDNGRKKSILDSSDQKTASTFPQLLSFVALAEVGTYLKAADELGITRQAVSDNIKNLEKSLNRNVDGRRLFVKEGDVQRLASDPFAQELLERARLMVFEYNSINRLRDDTLRIRYLPQHVFFMASVEARLERSQLGVRVRSRPLSEEDRAVDRFESVVLAALAGHALDFVVGMPPTKGSPTARKLTTRYLYSSHQVAMLPKSDPRDQIGLAELVEDGRMLVPPPQTRSRQVLEREIEKHLGHMPTAGRPDLRVKREAFGTKVLHEYGVAGIGTPVVPSDIANPFFAGNIHGGPQTADFKWVPVCLPDGTFIYQEVFASHSDRPHKSKANAIEDLFRLVQEEVRDRQLEKHPQGGSRYLDGIRPQQ
ncbi:Uncharacterised protein [Amycolatopsis camponoti]|uniref:HTH lysR-type domain-containing protein n=1 Tax=Amycolatopsis camponoti TaxID=2606593 RepID=A0A6I8LX44_9PSEU|nr:Uncharacterised protein [Amycolatopsis camponoti]